MAKKTLLHEETGSESTAGPVFVGQTMDEVVEEASSRGSRLERRT